MDDTRQLLLVWCPDCRVWKRLEDGKARPMRPSLVTERDGAFYWYRDRPERCDTCEASVGDPT